MKKITHVGVLVRDLDAAIARWGGLFGRLSWTPTVASPAGP